MALADHTHLTLEVPILAVRTEDAITQDAPEAKGQGDEAVQNNITQSGPSQSPLRSVYCYSLPPPDRAFPVDFSLGEDPFDITWVHGHDEVWLSQHLEFPASDALFPPIQAITIIAPSQ